jgi:hypothetical protein
MAGNGFLGGLIYGNPGYNSAPIDQGTQDVINKQVEYAESKKPEDYAKENLQGIVTTPDHTASNIHRNALGGASDDHMRSAIDSRSQRAMDFDINQLQRQSQVLGIDQRAKQLQNTFSGLTDAQRAMNAANAAQVQAWQNNQNQRASIINGIFSTVSGFGGYMQKAPVNNQPKTQSSGFGDSSSNTDYDFSNGSPSSTNRNSLFYG